MTRTKRTLLAIASLGALAFTGSAFAAGSSSLIMSATVTATCTFDSGSYSMNFGTLDPSANMAATQTSTLSYHCTAGQAASSVKVGGNNSPTTASVTNGTTVLPVQLTWTTPATVGTGFGVGSTPIPVTISGMIAAADISTATSGSYLGSTAVTVAP